MGRIRLALAALVGLCGPPALAGEIEGVVFTDTYRAANTELKLDCLGLLRYRVFFKAYVAGLYLPDGVAPGRALEDVPKRLELSYFWNIVGAEFGKSADGILRRNVDGAAIAAVRSRLDLLHSWYVDVQPGDRYALTYVPGTGTELALNDRPLGTIEGADFAAAYFSIWLGPRPIDESLKDQLTNCS